MTDNAVECWWEQEPVRFLNEHQLVEELKQDNSALKDIIWEPKSGQMTIEGKIHVQDLIRHFELIFPCYYPSECPTVYPVNRKEGWSKHQFGDGALCLELGPDNWHSDYTARDIIESLIDLLQGEAPIETPNGKIAGTVPSRHQESLGFMLRNETYRFLSTSDLQSACKDVDDTGAWKARLIFTQHSCNILPIELPKGQEIGADIPEILSKSSGIGAVYEGIFVKLDNLQVSFESMKNLENSDSTLEKLVSVKNSICETEGKTTASITPVLFISDDGHSQCLIIREKDGKLTGKVAKPVDINFSHLHARVPDEIRSVIADKKIGIIGLGSVGSKVAVSLARSGLENFILVDEDILLPENISRHQCDFQGIGAHKVSLIAQAIKQVSHSAIVEEHINKVGGQTNTAVHIKLLDKLRKCHTIVDCTANPNAFLILAMVCNQAKIPLVWGEVFGGGLGGIIASCIPEEDPCPLCVRRAMWDKLAQYPSAPGVATSDYTLEIGEQPPMVALDADVNFTASIMTQRAIYCLTKDENLSDAPPILLFGLRKGWIFKRPYEMIHISARKDDWHCEQCWQGFPKNETLSGKEKERYKKIMQSTRKSQDKD